MQAALFQSRSIKVTQSGELILTAYRTNNTGDRITEIRYCNPTQKKHRQPKIEVDGK